MYRIDPWGNEWQQTGLLAALLVNINSSSKTKPKYPEHFMPYGTEDGDPRYLMSLSKKQRLEELRKNQAEQVQVEIARRRRDSSSRE